jgi:predicted GH43/DUF377 family glycosyl hydrolase
MSRAGLRRCVRNAVFPCTTSPQEDRAWKFYGSGADKVMCAGTAVIDELVDLCLTHARPPL